MRIRYDSDADVLIIVLRDVPPFDSTEEPGGIIISYGEDRAPVSVELLGASERGLMEPGQSSVPLQHVSPTQER